MLITPDGTMDQAGMATSALNVGQSSPNESFGLPGASVFADLLVCWVFFFDTPQMTGNTQYESITNNKRVAYSARQHLIRGRQQ
jgi:hypothetical protein